MDVSDDHDELETSVPPKTVATPEQDKLLVELFQKIRQDPGNSQAWDRLYSLLFLPIQSTAFRIVNDYQVAEDVTQEVFLYIQQHAVDFTVSSASVLIQGAQVRTWVKRITINQAINAAKRRQRSDLDVSDPVLKDSLPQPSVPETHEV